MLEHTRYTDTISHIYIKLFSFTYFSGFKTSFLKIKHKKNLSAAFLSYFRLQENEKQNSVIRKNFPNLENIFQLTKIKPKIFPKNF